MRRLRAVVETVQSVLPVDMQQRLQFFKTRSQSPPAARRGPARSTSPPAMPGTELGEISLQEQQSTTAIMRKYERDVSRLDAKVEDLWQRLPKVVELVQPVQDQLFRSEIDTAEGNKVSGRSKLPLLVNMAHEAWNTNFQSFKTDFQGELRRMRSDLEKTIVTKASAGDVAALSAKLDEMIGGGKPSSGSQADTGGDAAGESDKKTSHSAGSVRMPPQERERTRVTQSEGRLPRMTSSNSFVVRQGSNIQS